MKAFLVRLNGRPLWLAGVGPHGALSTIVTWVGGGPRQTKEGRLHLHVGGIDSRTNEHLQFETPELRVGDKVTIEIVEADRVDTETIRFSADSCAVGRGSNQKPEEHQRSKAKKPGPLKGKKDV